MSSIIKVDTIQNQSGANIISESSNTITVGASGDTITVPSGATLGGAGTVDLSSATVTLNANMKNAPFFYGELASNQTTTRATFVKITGMTNNELDSNTAFDGTTFTVPSGQAGKYYLEGVMTASYGSVGQDGEQTIGSLYKNGVSIKDGIFRSDSSFSYTRAVTTIASGIFNLSVGDTIELYAYIQDSTGSDGLASASKTSLMGYKIIE